MDEAEENHLPAIEDQLSRPEPPTEREAFDRIFSKPNIEVVVAKAMLAFCLADEVEAMMADERDFDSNRYQMLLELLPVMPEGR